MPEVGALAGFVSPAPREGEPAHYRVGVEYQRKEGLIRSGLALHAWRLLMQYEELTKHLRPGQRYEATMSLYLLQSLLTNCYELYMYLDKRSPQVLGALEGHVEALLADPEVHVASTFPDEVLNAKKVIQHIRNALSHPTMQVTDPPTTGYTTVADGSGHVVRMRFTDSPDLGFRGRVKERSRVRTGGDPLHAHIFTIELPLHRLTALTAEVALVLAQPAVDNWDSAELVPLTA